MTSVPPIVRLLAWLLVAAVFALALALGWDGGADPLIDFGRELYVPWRLTLGDVLHRDIAWFNGPLGPWLIEGWMRVFGVSFDALQALNAVVIAAATVLLVMLMRVIADEFVAWLGALVFLGVFAVAQQEAVGNFLFLSPYSHGITFGFTAALGALVGLGRGVHTGSRGAFAAAGLCFGLAFLSKAEIFLGLGAAAGAMGLAYTLHRSKTTERLRGLGASLVLFSAGAALPMGLAALRFADQIGWDGVPLALMGTWPYALMGEVSDMPFYRTMRGTADLGLSLKRIAFGTGLTALFVVFLYALARTISRRTERPEIATAIGLATAGALTVGVFFFVSIKWVLLPLAVVLPLLALSSVRRTLHARGTEGGPRAIVLLGFTVFALGLLPKILFAPLARHYGFVLCVPGTMLLVALAARWIPLAMGGTPRAMAAARGAGVGLVLVFTAMNANATRNWYAKKVVDLGDGADRMRADAWRGTVLKALVEDLDGRVGPEATVLVLPEGISVNYLLRRRTPTRLVNFMPPEFVIFSEEEVIRALEAAPPAAVAFVHRPTDIYGYPFFGEGYGEHVMAWVRERYERVRLIEDEPFDPDGLFGAEVLMPIGGR